METEELEWVEGMRGSGDGRGRLDGLSCWQADGETSRKIRRWVEILRDSLVTRNIKYKVRKSLREII